MNGEIKKARKKYFQYEIKKSSGNIRETWKILNEAIGKKCNNVVVNKLSSASYESTNAADIANTFNKHFVEMDPNLAADVPPPTNSKSAADYMPIITSSFEICSIEPNDVLELIQKLNVRKAPGLDKVSNKLLKIAAPYIYKSLADIFNLSIQTSTFPKQWKVAVVLPLHKSGVDDEVNNYRPISFLSTIARLFERLMYGQLYSYLQRYEIINIRQSGFRSLHSTITALLDMTNQWCLDIDRGLMNGVIFLDLKKAFDTIDHNILFMKLDRYGLAKNCVKWFISYLSDRTQICHVNGAYSKKEFIKCGVPQGSILGPVLFLLYINDLPGCLDYSVGRLFADDTNTTFTGSSLMSLKLKMESDLNNIFDWLCANKLTLNVLKTDFMLIG